MANEVAAAVVFLCSSHASFDVRTFEVAVQGSLIVDNIPAAIGAAANGIGIALAAEPAVAAYAPPDSLEPLLDSWTAPFPGFHLCYPSNRHTAPAVRLLIDAVEAPAMRRRHFVSDFYPAALRKSASTLPMDSLSQGRGVEATLTWNTSCRS